MIGYPVSSVTRGVVDRALRDAGVEPRVEMEMGSPEAMRRLVEVGIGYAVLPERLVAAGIGAGSLQRLKLPRFRARRTLGFAHAQARALAPAAEAFMQHAFSELRSRAGRPPRLQRARKA
jgi:DNA-binding transcriptional LysR family regulator